MSSALDPHAAIVTTASGQGDGTLTTADGRPLHRALARSQRRLRMRALMLVVPLLLFVVVTFIVPIGQMLHRSIYNDGFATNMPQVSAWFAQTERGTDPDETAFAALAADLEQAAADRTLGTVGTRINYDLSGSRSLFTSTGRAVRGGVEPPYREALLEIDRKWGDLRLWSVMREASTPYTGNFYLSALDYQRGAEGQIQQVDENRRIYQTLFLRTLWLSLLVTGLTFVLGFPIAHLLATLPMRKSNLLMILCCCRSGPRCWCARQAGWFCCKSRGLSTVCWSGQG